MLLKFIAIPLCVVIVVAGMSGCRQRKEGLFSKLEAAESGIDFRNEVHDTDSTNSIVNEFGYMGGGVGIGDFNNDGLKDIVFTANQSSCRLYLNKGNNKFEDITAHAGLKTNVWATGVSIVDINDDGYDDIYICTYGKDLLHRSKNLLFINRGNLSFSEEATSYGLADTGYSSQAVFFDYDRDGDLDVYLANYLFSNSNMSANYVVPRDRSGNSPANDRLYRNDGDSLRSGHPVFTDVSAEAGIKEDGYGLGVTVSDFNNDGWPDIYVADDFVSNDNLWLNNADGTFTNCIAQSLRHQSYSSMGVDAADLNNDGLSDIVVVDMLPEFNERKKTSYSFMNYDRYQAERIRGYEPQFIRNMLQLNNGNRRTSQGPVPFFSEIGQFAGIAQTDWSWSVLLADFDNDGWKDVHITNGVGRDFINADFLEFSNHAFETITDKTQQQRIIRQRLSDLKSVRLSNYLYLNNRDYSFKDVSASAAIDEPSLSNGAAYADLDNDGDLDLVVNNINQEAFLFINNTITASTATALDRSHYLKLIIAGRPGNRHAVGTKICVFAGGKMQMQEQIPVRGYYSSVDQDLVFGLGEAGSLDSIIAVWPDGKRSAWSNIRVDTTLVLGVAATSAQAEQPRQTPVYLFNDVTSSAGIDYRHTEYEVNDFADQRLLPQKFSQLGPFITSGDVNLDGSIDFFIGGASNFTGKLFVQAGNGGFQQQDIAGSKSAAADDMDCLLFDADNDNDLDLLVTYAAPQQPHTSSILHPMLFINDGKANFTPQPASIPPGVRLNAGTVSAGDYDGDGDLDLFIGGRVSRQYPQLPRSYMLQNNGGVFTDVTASVCPALERAGMVTSSAWADIDNDNIPDLIIAGEWMPVRIFKSFRGRLQEITGLTGLDQMNGMWRSLSIADIDGDGDKDILAGNLGQNCNYRTSKEEPMKLFAKDLDGNGWIDPVFFYYIKGNDGLKHLFPAISRSMFADQVPSIKKKFLYVKDFSRASLEDIFPGNKREGVIELTCDETRTCWLENLGHGKFSKHVLPNEAQFAPVNAIICDDVDGDGLNDLIIAGNEYQQEVMTGRFDASYGLFLKGSKDMHFTPVPSTRSGLLVDGDVRSMKLINTAGKNKTLLMAINNDSLRVFRIGKM